MPLARFLKGSVVACISRSTIRDYLLELKWKPLRQHVMLIDGWNIVSLRMSLLSLTWKKVTHLLMDHATPFQYLRRFLMYLVQGCSSKDSNNGLISLGRTFFEVLLYPPSPSQSTLKTSPTVFTTVDSPIAVQLLGIKPHCVNRHRFNSWQLLWTGWNGRTLSVKTLYSPPRK